MRAQPWDSSYNANKDDRKYVPVSMENGIILPPLSNIGCLASHREDKDAVSREHEADLAKRRKRQKRITKPQSKEIEFRSGRRRRPLPDFPEGSYPALSQVPMGSNPILEESHPAKKRHQEYKRGPISQVSCLLSTPEENPRSKPEFNVSKFQIHDSDSTYVKLAKSGGHRDLLHHDAIKPPLQRSRDTSYSPATNGMLPALKSKSVQDPTWRPQLAVLSPIKKKED